MTTTQSAYDNFSQDYDRFVNWDNRLAFELPFLTAQLTALGEPGHLSLLDSACGTGMHVLALARRGYTCAGADISAGMIERSRANALAAEIPAEFKQAAFGELARSFAPQSFDALLCLGNSLPHLLSPGERLDALRDFADCLRPGGLIILQNRNFDAVMTRREHWMEPQSHQKDGAEWVFLRLYDYLPDGLIDFHIVVLRRLLGEGWRQQVNTTRLAPLLQADLTAQLASTGFDRIAVFGGLDGSAFDPQKSANLVITARKS